ncbi:hypothetical protein Q3O93_02825 [Ralstonia pseudosolanacearum]|uniref:hypothetical protein n=1 Tax=Ralstonia pseudosolanacearum TaxID=1310165 RepID=UPI002676FC11|nr:hypothetical protein [Ralstonia pseudosolanacearum]MDO3530849.1 hypothetical protein [Ralstonia pseudosolanacearum]
MDATNAMDVFPPPPVSVAAGGECLDITPLRVGELPAFLRAVQPVASRLAGDIDWITLFAEEGERMLDLVALAARRPRAWVADLPIDEAIVLAEALIAVNADFFVRRVAPGVSRMAQGIATRIAGATPSSGSSAADTVTTTS